VFLVQRVLQAMAITAVLAVFSHGSSVMAEITDPSGKAMDLALSHTKDGNWEDAYAAARSVSDPVGQDIITWIRLRDGAGLWPEYLDFLNRFEDWPGLDLLHKRGEGAMPEGLPPGSVLGYFERGLPQTGAGALNLAKAYEATRQRPKAHAEAIRAWTTLSMSKSERIALYAAYEAVLAPHNVERLDMLLWRGSEDEAKALYDLVPEEYVKLAKARLALKKRRGGVDALIAALPEAVKGDAGLAYERFAWRARNRLYDSALDLLAERSGSAARLGRPEAWAERRRSYARQEMRNDNIELAYRLASQHFLTEGSDYADLEWLAGYIALRKLNDPTSALRHFERFQAAVETPISYGRAGYWKGRAYEALGDKEAARAAYAFGAAHQTSFYGQLAAEKINAAGDPTLAGRYETPHWKTAPFLNSTVLRAAVLLHLADRPYRAERFLRHMADSQGPTGLHQLADIALALGRPEIAVRVSKQAARQGHVLPRSYFPITDLAEFDGAVPPELAMSIARRESELNPVVISPAGARGLMQVMPKTARNVAKSLGITYSAKNLTEDWEYNATLGTSYLAEQIAAFNGSYILAFVAYNAGPHRAKTWIDRYGDPRKKQVDQVDWIEHIPFRETRNYVMRVMESVHVYRARISGKVPKIRITKDLRRG